MGTESRPDEMESHGDEARGELNMREIIVDNFAGGGGASTGIELATGRSPEIAINHDPEAIAMHKANHPDSEHFEESVWDVDPVKACKGRPVGLAWFSPDCKHFSKAKGGKPKNKNIRALAWVAVRWAHKVRPRVIMLENVEEFQTWGPLDDDGYPIKEKQGETFRQFVAALRKHGYAVEWRELKACDYGAPTSRKRFFLIARCDGRPIVWPEPSHGNPDSIAVRCGTQNPWRTAAEIINWDIPCPSIFERTKPLVENTLRRIARGIQRFVIDNPTPFLVRIGQQGFGGDRLSYPLDKPLTTVVTKQEHCLIAPTIARQFGTSTGHPIDQPLATVMPDGGGKSQLIAANLIQYHSETASDQVRGQDMDTPIMTVDAANRYGLVSSFLAKHFGGNYTGPGASLDDPLPTITATDHNALVEVSTGGDHADEVRAFLTTYYGNPEDVGQRVDEPMRTVVSKDRFGLVAIHGEDYQITDIGMRMLNPRELFNAQGFPEDYTIDHDAEGKPYPKSAQVARCGNAVPPPLPAAMVRANLPDMCEEEVA